MSLCTAKKSQMILFPTQTQYQPMPHTNELQLLVIQLHERISHLEHILSDFIISMNNSNTCITTALKNTNYVRKSKQKTKQTLHNLKKIVLKCNSIPSFVRKKNIHKKLTKNMCQNGKNCEKQTNA